MNDANPKDFANFSINGLFVPEFDPFVLSEYLAAYSQREAKIREEAERLHAKATRMRRFLYNANQAAAAYERHKKVERHENSLIEENRILRAKLYEFMDRRSVHEYVNSATKSD